MTDLSIDDEDEVPTGGRGGTPAEQLAFWRRNASRRAVGTVVVAVLLALLYAAGTAALSAIVHWLVRPQAGRGPPTWSPVEILVAAAFLARPVFYTAHIHFVTRSVAAVVARAAERGETAPARSFVSRTAGLIIILTRDLPTVLILTGVMVWRGGLVGLFVALFVLGGLLLATPAGSVAYSRYLRRYAAAEDGGAADHAEVLGRRASRSWAEASADVAVTVLVAALVGLRLAGLDTGPHGLAGVVVAALLLAGPMRRLARVAGRGDKAAAVSPPLRLAGVPQQRIFGLRSDMYLGRHLAAAAAGSPRAGLILVAAADVIATGPALEWLLDHPGQVVTDAEGRPLMGAVTEAPDALRDAIAAGLPLAAGAPWPTLVGGAASIYVRKLRRREAIELIDLRVRPLAQAERRLFDLVYKGVTDLVTRYLWPTPAFHLVRLLARLRIPPNAVTLVGMGLVVIAAWRFAAADWAGGLAAAWAMTFLDTVDGKLARVTGSSSRIGDILDHGTDWIHPPAWWICVAVGLRLAPGADGALVTAACVVILAAYLAGRACEAVFKTRFRFNQYMWTRFDSRLRLVIARRNINLLVLTVGVLAGRMELAFVAVAAWSLASIGIQVVRTVQAWSAASRGVAIGNWMSEDPGAQPG